MNDIKASITLTGPIDVLAKLLASLGGNVSIVNTSVASAPVIPPITLPPGDDDESADTAVAPGSVDKDGLPWDERIHSTPAKLTGKGVWRKKRGVTDGEVAAVEAELRARGPQQPAAPVAPAPVMMPPPAAPMALPPGVTLPPTPAPVMMPPPAAPVAPAPVMMPPPAAPAPVQPAVAPTDFQSFMNAIQPLLQSGKLTAEYFGNLVPRVNAAAGTQFTAITDVNTRPDLIGWVWQIMQNDGVVG